MVSREYENDHNIVIFPMLSSRGEGMKSAKWKVKSVECVEVL